MLAPLAAMASASAIDGVIQREMGGKERMRARNGFTLVVSNDDLDGYNHKTTNNFRCIN